MTDAAQSYISVHHLQYRAEVITEGDLDFITKKSGIHNNVQCLSGHLPCSLDDEVTVVLFRLYKYYGEQETVRSHLCIYPPTIRLYQDEVKSFDKLGQAICQEVCDTLTQKGWVVEAPVIQTKWVPHFALNFGDNRSAAIKLTDSTRSKIYLMLLEGMCQEEIARKLHICPSSVSRHVRRLEDDGYLKIDRTQHYCRVYGHGIEKGAKEFPLAGVWE